MEEVDNELPFGRSGYTDWVKQIIANHGSGWAAAGFTGDSEMGVLTVRQPKLLEWEPITSDIPEEPERHIYPFIKPGDMVVIVAKAGEGKSTLGADLMIGHSGPLECSPDVLGGAFQVNRAMYPLGVSGILDGDQWPHNWSEAFIETARARGMHPAELDDTLSRVNHLRYEKLAFEEKPDDAIEDLVHSCKMRQVTLLIIDPMHVVFGMGDVVDLSWVFKRLAKLRSALKFNGITSVLMAHPAHEGGGKSLDKYFSPAGTAAQLGVFDARFGLKRMKRYSKLYMFKAREIRWIETKTIVDLPHCPEGAGFAPANKGFELWPFHKPPISVDPKAMKVLKACPQDRAFTLPEMYEKSEANPTPIRKPDILDAFRYYLSKPELVEPTGEKVGRAQMWRVTEKGKLAIASTVN